MLPPAALLRPITMRCCCCFCRWCCCCHCRCCCARPGPRPGVKIPIMASLATCNEVWTRRAGVSNSDEEEGADVGGTEGGIIIIVVLEDDDGAAII